MFNQIRLTYWFFLKVISITIEEICSYSNIRSFRSLRKIYDAKMLFKLVTQCDNFSLSMRLSSQSIFFLRFPGKISIADLSKKKVGMNSFMNRAKAISESIHFEWMDMSPSLFDITLKRTTPLCIWIKIININYYLSVLSHFTWIYCHLNAFDQICLSCFIALDK